MKCLYLLYLIINIIFLIITTTIDDDDKYENKYEEKIIYFPFKLNFNSFYANILFGEPPQKLLLSLDQELQVTWAETHSYNQLLSDTSQEINKTELKFRKIRLFGKTISDKILFINEPNLDNYYLNETKNISINNFWFVIVGNSRGYDSRVGGIGLSYKFAYEEYSLIHHFKKNNLVNHLSYGFIPPSIFDDINDNSTKKNKEGLIFFGGIPKNFIIDKYRYNCKVTDKYNFWSCNLPCILFGEITSKNNANNTLYYKNSNYAYFNGAERRILAPEDFMIFLKHNYFKDEINNRTCEYHLYGMNYVFKCLCSIKNNLPNISFVFDSYQYKFTPEELFDYYGGGNCLFLIQLNHLRYNNFVFGSPFLSKYISNFDYESKYITFYSKNRINKIDIHKFLHPSKVNNYIVIIIIILLVVLVLFIRKKIKDKKYKKELLLMKNKDKSKIKKMNGGEEGYELK